MVSQSPPFAQNAKPVIIAGAPRSGTTFLTTALNSHPQILITNELRAWTVFNDLNRRLEKPSEMLPEHPARDKFKNGLLRHCAKYFRAFYEKRITEENLGCSSGSGDSVEPVIKAYGDKNPGYADTHQPGCLQFIAKMLPEAKFLHIHRDPRSCVASYMEIPVYSDEISRCIDTWQRHTTSMVQLKDALGDRVLEISYEAFTTPRGESIFAAIEDHLGVDHAKEPVAFLEREMASRTPYRSPTTPVEQLGKKTYQSRLDKSQIEEVEKCCGELMERLGYAD